MKRLLVQNYLINHSLDDLAKEHGVYARVSGTKASLNYDMIESREDDPLACECRGLILRQKTARVGHENLDKSEIVGDTEVLARGFDRFFNHGQSCAAKIDFNDPNLLYLNKLDGSYIAVYFDANKDEWCVATRGTPEADCPVNNDPNGLTFRVLFERVIQEKTGYAFKAWANKQLAKDCSYCFELMTPYNQVVVRHNSNNVALLMIRNLNSGEESSPGYVENAAKMFGVGVPEAYKIKNFDDLGAFVNSRDPLSFEGIVVLDPKSCERVKVKSAAYVLAHKTVSSFAASRRNILEIILSEKLDDLMPILPDDHKKIAEGMKEKLYKWMQEFEINRIRIWNDILAMGHMSEKVIRKEYAVSLQHQGMMLSACMAIYEGKARDLKDWMQGYAKNRQKNGKWSDSFLDQILEEISRI